MFKGSLVAIITPFNDRGKIDRQAFERLIEFQIANGTDGIVPCGTTGESATLTHREHEELISLAVEIVGKRVPVIAGTGSNSTAEAIRLTKSAKDVGADGALVITPYYNKPTQEGLYLYFKAVAGAVDIPVVAYNVPGRTGVNLLPTTLLRMTEIKNLVAVKEASGSVRQMTEILSLCGDRITLLSGDDFLTLPLLAVGGRGVISVAANIMPERVSRVIDEFEAGNLTAAAQAHLSLYPLYKACFYETNPMPAKTALSLMGKCEGYLRPPLCPMSEENLGRLKSVLAGYGLI